MMDLPTSPLLVEISTRDLDDLERAAVLDGVFEYALRHALFDELEVDVRVFESPLSEYAEAALDGLIQRAPGAKRKIRIAHPSIEDVQSAKSVAPYVLAVNLLCDRKFVAGTADALTENVSMVIRNREDLDRTLSDLTSRLGKVVRYDITELAG
jgi:hypothetical protein